jgi:N-acetylmuramoyl-L-alanine amidase
MSKNYSKTVILDPGHGLEPDGSYQRPLMDSHSRRPRVVPNSMYPHPNDHKEGFYREDFGTLKIAKAAADVLRQQGYTVLLTRDDERNARLFLSAQSTNKWKQKHWKKWKWIKDFTVRNNADMFVSVHTNAGKGTGARCKWASSPNGILLSRDLGVGLKEEAGIKMGRIAKHRYLILRDVCDGRAVLLECLFHDSAKDIKMLVSEEGIRKIGKGIAYGINKHFENAATAQTC